MTKLVFGMNQSLDGYVDVDRMDAPSPALFRHFIEEAQGQTGSVYGRKMYEIMRYWDNDHPEWDADQHAFAAAWRCNMPTSRARASSVASVQAPPVRRSRWSRMTGCG